MSNRAGQAFVRADASGLRRVIGNLVDNAIKFTERGEVRVEVSASIEQVFLRVSDTGEGIASVFLPRLFDEFQQESKGLNRSHEGSGLGLAVTQRIVDLMGGRVEVESEKGRGSIFTVILPRVAAAAEPALENSGITDSVAWVTGGTSTGKASHLRRVALK